MSDYVVENKPTKVAMPSGTNRESRQSRIEQDEAELERLMNGQGSSEEENDENQEAPEEEKESPDSSDDLESTETDKGDNELSEEEQTFKKRYGDLRKHSQKKEKELKDEIKTLKDRVEELESNTPEKIEVPEEDKDLKEWMEKYPDVASIVEKIAEKKAEEKFKNADSRLKEIDRLSEENAVEKAEREIKKKHDDYDDLKASDDFHNWLEEQPQNFQDAIYEDLNAKAAIRIIDFYKAEKGLTKRDKKKAEKEAASAVKTRQRTSVDYDEVSKQIRESEVAKMSDKEFEANMEKIQKAQQSGNFIYDVSGGAR